MATKSSTRSSQQSAAESQATMEAAAGASTDAARQQMALAADACAGMLHANETMLLACLHSCQRVALIQRQAAESVRQASGMAELMAIQMRLGLESYQESVRFVQELVTAGVGSAAQGAAAARAPDTGAPTGAATAAGLADAAMTAAAPMMQAWQQMFTAATSAGGGARHH